MVNNFEEVLNKRFILLFALNIIRKLLIHESEL